MASTKLRSTFLPGALALLLSALVCGCGDNGNGDGNSGAPDAAGIPTDESWQPLPSVGGGAIQEIGVAELDGVIYVIGGFTNTNEVADVRAYDIAANAWRDVAPLPRPLHHANAVAMDGKLYVLGSLIGIGFAELATSWVYDPGADEWTEVAAMNPDDARGSSAMGVIDGKIYVVGGFRDRRAVANVSSYDPVNDQWDDTLPDLPGPSDHLVGAAIDGMFYAIGGRNGAINSITQDVYAFDPANPQAGWVARAGLPTARGGMAAGVVDGKIVVVGGEGNPGDSSGVFPQTENYDPAADEWTVLPAMRTPRHGMGAAGHDGKLYVPGGATVQGFGAVATFEVFTP